MRFCFVFLVLLCLPMACMSLSFPPAGPHQSISPMFGRVNEKSFKSVEVVRRRRQSSNRLAMAIPGNGVLEQVRKRHEYAPFPCALALIFLPLSHARAHAPFFRPSLVASLHSFRFTTTWSPLASCCRGSLSPKAWPSCSQCSLCRTLS